MTDLAPRETINFIAFLRGPAALLTVYHHLVIRWPGGVGLGYLNKILSALRVPLPGVLGVAIFFLISGFIITHVSQRDGRANFATKRFFRIYPTFLVSLMLILFLRFIGPFFTDKSVMVRHFEYKDVFLSAFLIKLNMNDVNWTLVIEVLFYSLTFFFLPLLKSSPLKAASLNVFIAMALSASALIFVPAHPVTRKLPYLSIIILGQLIYYLQVKKISFKSFLLLSLSVFGYMVFAFMRVDPIVPASVVYAYLIFIGGLRISSAIKMGAISAFFSKISYSLYLLHWPVGWFVLTVLSPEIGNRASLLIALCIVIGLSYLSWRYIEEPSIKFGRRFLSKPKATAPMLEPVGKV